MSHILFLCVDNGFLLCLYEALDQTCESSFCWNMLLVSLLITGMQIFDICSQIVQTDGQMLYASACVKFVAVGRGLLWPLPRVWSSLPGAADRPRPFRHGAQSAEGAEDLRAETNVWAR